jgi:two-component system, NarL family, response regulator LiaR
MPRVVAKGKRRPIAAGRPPRVAVVNDYEVIVAGVCGMLASYRDRVHVVEIDVKKNPDHVVDVALFDTYGQPILALDRIRSLIADERVGAVAIYTWTLTGASRAAAHRVGAHGLIAKALPAGELVDALVAVAGGRFVDTGRFRGGTGGQWPGSRWGLTGRESEVLAMVATGLPNRAIGDVLFVSENTVRTHLKAVFRKLGVTSRSQAVARALTDPTFATRPPIGGRC